ncbi:MAG TPA: hypothetical protein VHO47_04685 [Candidatus Babeliales bacterium]|nr:hypothetical protein [Candidatus Babeliales bacterium]
MNKKIIIALLAAFVGSGQYCIAMQIARSFKTNITTKAPRYKGQWHIAAGNDQKFENVLHKNYAFDGNKINIHTLGIITPDKQIDQKQFKKIESDLNSFAHSALLMSRPSVSYPYDFFRGALKTSVFLGAAAFCSTMAGLNGLFPETETLLLLTTIGGIGGAMGRNLLPVLRWKPCYLSAQKASQSLSNAVLQHSKDVERLKLANEHVVHNSGLSASVLSAPKLD